MNREYWLKRWQENRIGFHQAAVNALLARFWPQLHVPRSARVMVPLCGKSIDLKWLAEQGHEVIGVELAETAAQAFFAEQRLEPTITTEGSLRVYRAGRLAFYVGDIFAVKARTIGHVDVIYDRAALIALPRERRAAYVAHLWGLLAPAGRMLLITLEYDAACMEGPPYAVANDEVHTLFAGRGRMEELFGRDCLEEEPRFKERGLTWLKERVFLITRSSI
jgi:thiopurine S-methyltransferase